MRLISLLLSTALISACGLVYKLPTRQGNVIEQKQVDKLELGMSFEQVRFVLGTPLAASAYVNNRWDYLGYYKTPRGNESSRVVSLYFDAGRLARIEDSGNPRSDAVEQPDVETILEQEQKDEQDQQEPDTGITIKQST